MNRIRLIALDMDGTLLRSDHYTVPQENVEAIRDADAAGIRVCISTGRMLEDASDFIHRLGLPCMIIAGNGARASDGPLPEGRILLRHSLAPDDAHAALDILMRCGLVINGFEDGLVSTVRRDSGWVYHLVKRGLIGARYGEASIREAADRGIMKIFAVAAGSGGDGAVDPRVELARKEIRHALAHLQITSSAPDNIEIMPPGAGKGAALSHMARRFGLARENVMAVGDAQNDLSMLEYAFHSVAMGNASPEIKAVCRYETASNDDCGVAKIIRCVLEARP